MPRVLTEMAQRSFVRLSSDTVAGVEEAIIYLQQHETHVILLDLSTAVQDGDMEPLYRLHRLRPDTPIVVLFGSHDTGLAILAMRIGATDVGSASDLDVRGLWRAVYSASMRVERRDTQNEVSEAFGFLVGCLCDLTDCVGALRVRMDRLGTLLDDAIKIAEGASDE